MEKTEDISNIEGASNDDQGLSEELESLYHRVARLDQPEASVENVDANGNDKDFKDLQRRTAPYQNQPNQEELMEKLMAIKEAYERLLTYWPFARERPRDFL
jgi:hypothetical protein